MPLANAVAGLSHVLAIDEGLGFPAGLAAGGLLTVVCVFYEYRRSRLMRDTPTSDVESMAVGSVELEGIVESADKTVTAPVTGKECVVVDYSIAEYKRHDDIDKEWTTVDSGFVSGPFYVNDGTDRVLVDAVPDDSHVEISHANHASREFAASASLPTRLSRFVSTYADIDVDSRHKRRYSQSTIPLDEEVYVFGDAELADAVETSVDPESDLVVTTDADTEMFLVSDKAESEIATHPKALLALALIGFLMFTGGLWWFLAGLGL